MLRRRSLLPALLLALLATGCGDDEQKPGSGEGPAARVGEAPTATGGSQSGEQTAKPGCRTVAAPKPKPDGGERKPSRKLDPATTYEVELSTSCGAFTIRLDQRTSPAAAASFAALARSGFFDGTVFHRIVPGFVIQGGDPTAGGSGGPGYSTRDAVPAGARYVKGVVAMAKTAQEPPGTAGSQFYVVTGADAGLPPEYGLLGKVTRGLGVVERIGALGDPATEMPTQPVVVERATVRERR